MPLPSASGAVLRLSGDIQEAVTRAAAQAPDMISSSVSFIAAAAALVKRPTERTSEDCEAIYRVLRAVPWAAMKDRARKLAEVAELVELKAGSILSWRRPTTPEEQTHYMLLSESNIDLRGGHHLLSSQDTDSPTSVDWVETWIGRKTRKLNSQSTEMAHDADLKEVLGPQLLDRVCAGDLIGPRMHPAEGTMAIVCADAVLLKFELPQVETQSRSSRNPGVLRDANATRLLQAFRTEPTHRTQTDIDLLTLYLSALPFTKHWSLKQVQRLSATMACTIQQSGRPAAIQGSVCKPVTAVLWGNVYCRWMHEDGEVDVSGASLGVKSEEEALGVIVEPPSDLKAAREYEKSAGKGLNEPSLLSSGDTLSACLRTDTHEGSPKYAHGVSVIAGKGGCIITDFPDLCPDVDDERELEITTPKQPISKYSSPFAEQLKTLRSADSKIAVARCIEAMPIAFLQQLPPTARTDLIDDAISLVEFEAGSIMLQENSFSTKKGASVSSFNILLQGVANVIQPTAQNKYLLENVGRTVDEGDVISILPEEKAKGAAVVAGAAGVSCLKVNATKTENILSRFIKPVVTPSLSVQKALRCKPQLRSTSDLATLSGLVQSVCDSWRSFPPKVVAQALRVTGIFTEYGAQDIMHVSRKGSRRELFILLSGSASVHCAETEGVEGIGECISLLGPGAVLGISSVALSSMFIPTNQPVVITRTNAFGLCFVFEEEELQAAVAESEHSNDLLRLIRRSSGSGEPLIFDPQGPHMMVVQKHPQHRSENELLTTIRLLRTRLKRTVTGDAIDNAVKSGNDIEENLLFKNANYLFSDQSMWGLAMTSCSYECFEEGEFLCRKGDPDLRLIFTLSGSVIFSESDETVSSRSSRGVSAITMGLDASSPKIVPCRFYVKASSRVHCVVIRRGSLRTHLSVQESPAIGQPDAAEALAVLKSCKPLSANLTVASLAGLAKSAGLYIQHLGPGEELRLSETTPHIAIVQSGEVLCAQDGVGVAYLAKNAVISSGLKQNELMDRGEEAPWLTKQQCAEQTLKYTATSRGARFLCLPLQDLGQADSRIKRAFVAMDALKRRTVETKNTRRTKLADYTQLPEWLAAKTAWIKPRPSPSKIKDGLDPHRYDKCWASPSFTDRLLGRHPDSPTRALRVSPLIEGSAASIPTNRAAEQHRQFHIQMAASIRASEASQSGLEPIRCSSAESTRRVKSKQLRCGSANTRKSSERTLNTARQHHGDKQLNEWYTQLYSQNSAVSVDTGQLEQSGFRLSVTGRPSPSSSPAQEFSVGTGAVPTAAHLRARVSTIARRREELLSRVKNLVASDQEKEQALRFAGFVKK